LISIRTGSPPPPSPPPIQTGKVKTSNSNMGVEK